MSRKVGAQRECPVSSDSRRLDAHRRRIPLSAPPLIDRAAAPRALGRVVAPRCRRSRSAHERRPQRRRHTDRHRCIVLAQCRRWPLIRDHALVGRRGGDRGGKARRERAGHRQVGEVGRLLIRDEGHVVTAAMAVKAAEAGRVAIGRQLAWAIARRRKQGLTRGQQSHIEQRIAPRLLSPRHESVTLKVVAASTPVEAAATSCPGATLSAAPARRTQPQ